MHTVYRVDLHLHGSTVQQICRVRDFGETAQWKGEGTGLEELLTPGCVSTGSQGPTCWSDHSPAGSLVLGEVLLFFCPRLKEYYRNVAGSVNGKGTLTSFFSLIS